MEDYSLRKIIWELRQALTEYRYNDLQNHNISILVNQIEIALSLSEFAYVHQRSIKQTERIWFEVNYSMIHTFSGTTQDKMLNLYTELVEYAKKKNYFE